MWCATSHVATVGGCDQIGTLLRGLSNVVDAASDALELVNSNLFCSLRTTPEFLDSNDLIERCLVESCAALYEMEQIYKFQASNWSFIKKERCLVGI